MISKNSKKKFGFSSAKRAELTFSMIIVAIIALIVLFVIISFFSEKIWNVDKTIDDCISDGGLCVKSGSCNGLTSSAKCPEDGQVCCKGLVIVNKKSNEGNDGSSGSTTNE